ncbi:MAG TPA: hypothetical protein VHD56_10750 [Tepidisphaeraceae bacterium]|nr:hypothetical protein [Tepidisphaeraceae bacterium]
MKTGCFPSVSSFLVAGVMVLACSFAIGQPIDRQALVSRHNITVTTFDPLSPLSLGNGDFAFTVDPTGLQTFSEAYERGTPLTTMSQWGWHSNPMPDAIKGQPIQYQDFETYGRKVGYLTGTRSPQAIYMRENPHRFHLGRIGLDLKKADGSPAKPEDLKNVKQTLDLWTGVLTSTFEFEGKPVKVTTVCGGDKDTVGARIESALKIPVTIAFPYGSPGNKGYDWSKPDAHKTEVVNPGAHGVTLSRTMDDIHYGVNVNWTGDAEFKSSAPHRFTLQPAGETLEFACGFAVNPGEHPSSVNELIDASKKFWHDYWMTGGAVDLSGSSDPRWMELERRIVLSQYQLCVNNSGNLPPAETGLVANATWYGKFHLEMHWWHDVHWALWDRQDIFERSMGFYQKDLAFAQANAKRQGYEGARWPKMVGPDGIDSPSGIAPLLIWEQPHPIYYAELCYRAHPDKKTLEQWQKIVEESADFMASFAVLDKATGKYVLGPPVKTVPEHNDTNKTRNPTFELSYWRFGLRVAQQWRERMGLPRNAKWDEVLNNLSPLPQKDGVYLMQEGQEDVYTNPALSTEHPSVLGALGVLPGDGVDPAIMKATVQKVMQVWRWDGTWGWDFPMTAMAAARTGQPEVAMDALFVSSPKNKWLPNGHVYQRDSLTLYLPANGGFLTTIAMMCAGWDGGPEGHAPGFPKNGWNVKYENLKKMP